MGNKALAAGIAVVVSGWVSTAAAQGFPDFGHAGTVAVGAERLMGLSFASVDVEGGGDSDFTGVYLLGNPAHSSPYDVPKFTFDYFVTDRFSNGTGLVFASLSPDEGDNVTYFAINPRIGGGFPIADKVGIWARGGITYYTSGDDDIDISGLGLNLDAMFVLGVTDSFAFTIGPVADIGLTGSAESDLGGEVDFKYTNFGANAGVVGLF